MLRIQDPLLEDILHFCSLENECVFLDTSLPDNENFQSLLFVKPVSRLVCREGDDLELYLQGLQQQLASGYYLAGWAGYEFGSLLEGRYGRDTSFFSRPPEILADFGVFLKPYTFDHHSGKNSFPPPPEKPDSKVISDYSIDNLKSNMDQEEFTQALGKIKEFIAAGDTYQVNYTMKLLFDFHGSLEGLYQSLRRNQSVAYGAYIKNRKEYILSFSPELFFRKTTEKITVRPMKGTAVRGYNHHEEQRHKAALHHDSKNRAENVMIVDLLRNDLARLLYEEKDTSVTTQSLFDVESYESLLQMTSTVTGTASGEAIKNLSLNRLFHSLFPCGSITGAPKIRTMQIIQKLEKEARGVYTGAIGYLAPDGDAVFNVPIRTICLRGAKGEMGIGAGITHDSVPAEEWRESLLKGRFLTHSQENFQLFETILWEKGSGFFLLDQHLARLARGAAFFKFSFAINEAEKRLHKEAAGFTADCMRVRLVLEKDGRMVVTHTTCEPPLYISLPVYNELHRRPIGGTVRFAAESVEEGSPYLYYKTSRRSLYDRQYSKVVEKGELDAIFCNKKVEVTEGCISNIVVLKNGVYSTPLTRCGLLPGVMREYLLSSANGSSELVETILTRKDVQEADALFICNSVRGIVRVQLAA